MPITHLVCPHCDQSAELNVTSVTRSRECPKCGKMIILQFTTKETRLKRKALLMPVTTSADSESASEELATGPRVLEGDVRRRMLHDPEVQSSARRLLWGSAIAGGLVLLLVLGHFFQWWPALGKAATDLTQNIRGAPKLEEPSDLITPPPLAQEAGTLRDDVEDPASPAALPPVETEKEKAVQAVAIFLSAKNVDERLQLVRDRKLNEPKMRDYYAKNPDGPVSFERVEDATSDSDGPHTYSFQVVLPTGERRKILVGKATSGEYVVDWASFVLYGDLTWSEFMEKRPQDPVLLRVLATVDDYYNHNFVSPRTVGCLRLVDPRSPDSPPIYAYYVRTSTLGREMEFLMRKSFGEAVPLVVTLYYPPDTDSNNQVWLEERIAEGWVVRGR